MAVVISAVNVRRLMEGMVQFVHADRDYWLVDIYRPLEELGRILNQWRPAGIITEWLPEITPTLIHLGYPTVVATTDVHLPGVASVDVDDVALGQRVADYLVDCGLRHLAFLGKRTPYSEQRLEGFRRGLALRGADCSVFIEEAGVHRQYMEYWRGSDARLLGWVRSLPKPVGIFAAHDPLGRTLTETCRDLGLSMPEAVAIVGANNDPLICNLTHPPLSSVEIDWHKIGQETARQMERLIAGHPVPPKPILLPPGEVVTRLSSDIIAVPHARLAAALRHLRDLADRPLTIQQVSDHLHWSRRQMEIAFRKFLGRTPREELTRLRLRLAKRLLTDTDWPLSMVAERSGFGSPERFSKTFRDQVGVSPGRWRKGGDPAPIQADPRPDGKPTTSRVPSPRGRKPSRPHLSREV